ncbi:MAG: hypothetical protein C5B50_16545 [Verrucomicrobia bacterium]|nr:MAG: hypothetical protein C5B50_16545 [Verrucomicrobiota bacterium]
MGVALTLGFGVAKAQVTNVVTTANIALSGFENQTDATPVRITTRDILTLLGASTGSSFSRNAQLVLLSQNDQLPTFAVRDKLGSNVITTDVSSFLYITEATEVNANRNTLSYSAQTFNFDDQNGTSFTASGFTTLRRGKITGAHIGSVFGVIGLSSQVAGYGSAGGKYTVLSGTITAGSARAEVDD